MYNCEQCGKTIYFEGTCLACESENEKKVVLSMTNDEIEKEIIEICNEIKELKEIDTKSQSFTDLINYRDIDTTKIADVAFENKVYYPCEIYKNASDEVVNAMIELLKGDDLNRRDANCILRCLSIRGGDTVFNAFKELEKNPPAWRANLHVNPSVYANEGGWTYDTDGNFRKTMFDKCYPIVKGTLEEKAKSPVKLFAKTDEICPLCGGHTVDLMQIDSSDERLSFLGTDENITVKCCPSCVIYSSGDFARYTSDGKGEIFISNGEANGYGSDDYEEEHEDFVNSLNENTYVLGLESVSPRYSADWGKGSTIGGYAFWVNDCNIHTCPDCGKPMKYLAQIDWGSQISGMGYLYIEVCTDCKVTSVQYQQS